MVRLFKKVAATGTGEEKENFSWVVLRQQVGSAIISEMGLSSHASLDTLDWTFRGTSHAIKEAVSCLPLLLRVYSPSVTRCRSTKEWSRVKQSNGYPNSSQCKAHEWYHKENKQASSCQLSCIIVIITNPIRVHTHPAHERRYWGRVTVVSIFQTRNNLSISHMYQQSEARVSPERMSLSQSPANVRI